MPLVKLGHETLYYERVGSGAPLVLMHSLGTSSELWSEQIDHWRSRFDVIAMDARGHGRSSNVGGVSIRNIAGDLLALMTHLNIPAAHFVGISMGGMICSRLHELRPSVVTSLVIANSLATAGNAGPAKADGLEKRIRSISLSDYGRVYADETLLPAAGPAKHRWLGASIGAMDTEAYVQTMRSIFTEDVTGCLRQMRMPVRVITGRQDQRTPLSLAEVIAGLARGSDLVVLDEAAHLSNLDNPAAFNSAVDEFLQRVEAPVN
jgi:3-oxoadipate enol-lactonase